MVDQHNQSKTFISENYRPSKSSDYATLIYYFPLHMFPQGQLHNRSYSDE